MTEGCDQVREGIPYKHRDDQRRNGNNCQVPAGLLTAERLFGLPHIKKKIYIKVYAEQDHKDRHNGLYISGIFADAAVFYSEASGSCRTEGGTQSVKQRHAPQQQQRQLQKRQGHIKAVQELGCGPHLGDQLADRWSRTLRLHQVHGITAAGHGQEA